VYMLEKCPLEAPPQDSINRDAQIWLGTCSLERKWRFSLRPSPSLFPRPSVVVCPPIITSLLNQDWATRRKPVVRLLYRLVQKMLIFKWKQAFDFILRRNHFTNGWHKKMRIMANILYQQLFNRLSVSLISHFQMVGGSVFTPPRRPLLLK